MKYSHSINKLLNPYKYIIYIFSGFALISYLFATITGKYNGDFFGTDVLVGDFILAFNLIATIAPLIFLWFIFKNFKCKELGSPRNHIPKYFYSFACLIILWNIFITLLFGVGVSSAPVYSAPEYLKPLIQTSLRINPFFIGFLVILSSRNISSTIFLSGLIISLSLARSSLGVFLFLSLLLFIKHNYFILRVLKKNTIAATIILLLLLSFAQGLFSIRAELRGFEKEELSMTDFAFGRLVGRLSSFPNSAVIIQEAPYFALIAKDYGTYFPLSQSLGGVITGSLIPEDRPEVTLYQLNNFSDQENISSFMAGVNGVLYFSLFKSWITVLISFLLYIFFIYSSLKMAYMTKRDYVLDTTYLSLIYLCVSGVLNEFGYLFMSVFVVLIIFKIHKLLSKTIRLSNRVKVDNVLRSDLL